MATEYTPDQRKEALALYVEVGPAEAERQTGIPKKTMLPGATAEVCRRTPRRKSRPRPATAKRKYDVEQFKARMTAALAEVAEIAALRAVRRNEPRDGRTRPKYDEERLCPVAFGVERWRWNGTRLIQLQPWPERG